MKPQQRKDWLDSQYSPVSGDNAVIPSRQLPSLFFFFGENLLVGEQSLAGSEFNEQKTICRPSACDKNCAREKMDGRNAKEMPNMRFHKAMERRSSRRNFWNTAALFLQRMWIAFFHVVKNQGKFFFFFFGGP